MMGTSASCRVVRRVTFGLVFGLTGFLAGTAGAADNADFFRGKTVTYIVATAPGGGYDFHGRLLSEYMQRHLEGSTFVVKNMPGAGHILGANYIYASKPDGLTIGTFNTGLTYNQLTGLKSLRFDLTRYSWLGKGEEETRIFVVNIQSGITSFEQLKTAKLKIPVSGVGTAAYVESRLIVEALGLNFEIIPGYNTNEEHLAMRRGEIQGSASGRTSYQAFVDQGYGRFIFQIGGRKSDLTQVADYVTDPATLSVINLIGTTAEMARFTAGPPEIPADRLGALRTAYRKALEDPEMIEKSAKAGRPLMPAYGDEVAAGIRKALNQPPEVVERLAAIINTKE
jgi:tripartite-type tricarboxylate transporter receptor subunit TctC